MEKETEFETEITEHRNINVMLKKVGDRYVVESCEWTLDDEPTDESA
jgi:hypothetical protein